MNEEQPAITRSAEDPSDDAAATRAAVLQRMIADLLSLPPADRQNVLETLATFFGLNSLTADTSTALTPRPTSSDRNATFHFSEESPAPSPKAFMFEKSPKTDVERVACLAYFLSHYRGVPHFRTKDITGLNTESAHKPFSNTAVSVENAAKMGYLVPSVKGSKQISALGERFVEALPDRDAAKEILEKFRHRRGGSGAGKKT